MQSEAEVRDPFCFRLLFCSFSFRKWAHTYPFDSEHASRRHNHNYGFPPHRRASTISTDTRWQWNKPLLCDNTRTESKGVGSSFILATNSTKSVSTGLMIGFEWYELVCLCECVCVSNCWMRARFDQSRMISFNDPIDLAPERYPKLEGITPSEQVHRINILYSSLVPSTSRHVLIDRSVSNWFSSIINSSPKDTIVITIPNDEGCDATWFSPPPNYDGEGTCITIKRERDWSEIDPTLTFLPVHLDVGEALKQSGIPFSQSTLPRPPHPQPWTRWKQFICLLTGWPPSSSSSSSSALHMDECSFHATFAVRSALYTLIELNFNHMIMEHRLAAGAMSALWCDVVATLHRVFCGEMLIVWYQIGCICVRFWYTELDRQLTTEERTFPTTDK